jgi:acyl-CoA thioesterase FadM
VASIGRTSFQYEYEIVSQEDGRMIAQAKTVQVAYDYAKGTPVEVPQLWQELLGKPLL